MYNNRCYLINRQWFEEKISCPNINGDLSYDFHKNDRKIYITTYLNSDEIYQDIFKK